MIVAPSTLGDLEQGKTATRAGGRFVVPSVRAGLDQAGTGSASSSPAMATAFTFTPSSFHTLKQS